MISIVFVWTDVWISTLIHVNLKWHMHQHMLVHVHIPKYNIYAPTLTHTYTDSCTCRYIPIHMHYMYICTFIHIVTQWTLKKLSLYALLRASSPQWWLEKIARWSRHRHFRLAIMILRHTPVHFCNSVFNDSLPVCNDTYTAAFCRV